ncbi:hypothetical protein LTR53_010019 [Teratosphaeriaceae sp. CCFEE 6253]|nr:hypothetical protein LTR53_010019 [Teratosphaeriaceae sp. CCFEE 6253]
MFDFGDSHLHHKLTEWSQTYGDFFSYTMAQSPVIVLSSPEVLSDLLLKRGQKYSSRPRSSAQASLMTQDARIVQLPYGERFRNAKMFLPFQEYESRQTLKNLLNEPKAFWEEVSRYSGSITFSTLLGCRFERSDAFIPQQIGLKMQIFFTNIRPGAWAVDWFPLLDCLPNILAPWRQKVVDARNQVMPFYSVFYDAMKTRMVEGTAPDCFVKRLLGESGKAMSETEHLHLMAELLTAGTETTATTLQWFMKAAVLYPETIARAQEELDRVVGHSRFPGWEDQARLPYLAALTAEVNRWGSATPLAFVHATSEADTYRGKTIPNEATVMVNLYGIHNNPAYYPEPEVFAPERFLKDDGRFKSPTSLKTHFAFGVGRRECPGKHVANASLFIMISRILWTFNVKPKEGALPGAGYSGCFPIFGPAAFECVIEPRSQSALQLVREQADINRPKEMEDSSLLYDHQLKSLV